jgi:hypothetical protein
VQLASLPESAPVMITVFPIIRFCFLYITVVHLKYAFSAVRRTSRINKTKIITITMTTTKTTTTALWA